MVTNGKVTQPCLRRARFVTLNTAKRDAENDFLVAKASLLGYM